MFCPGCSNASADGAKFCKSCGMNLTSVSQALSGGPATVDPFRDREYKRARKKISDGIQSAAAGLALVAVAAGIYLFLPKEKLWYGLSLVIALVGLIGFFRGLGHVLDAKVGQKLVDPALKPRATGTLSNSVLQTASISNPSKRVSPEAAKSAAKPDAQKRPVAKRPEKSVPNMNPATPVNPARQGTGRISGERPGLDRLSAADEDLMSKLRN